MNKATQHSRWHRIDPQSGEKIIRKFDVDAKIPAPWIRGTGPHTPEALAKVRKINAEHFKGKPKSANQREKMRQAKLGRKFTAAHRKNLSEAWKGKREMQRIRMIEAFKLAEAYGKQLNAQES